MSSKNTNAAQKTPKKRRKHWRDRTLNRLRQKKRQVAQGQADLRESQKCIQELQKNIQGLQERVQELELEIRKKDEKAVKLGSANLRSAAIRLLKGRNRMGGDNSNGKDSLKGDYGTADMPKQVSATSELDRYANGLQAKQMEELSGGILRGSDLKFLRNNKLTTERNTIAHEDWGELAVILMKEEFEGSRNNLDRIFRFVTGREIREMANKMLGQLGSSDSGSKRGSAKW
ncbi:hypothetical protein H072_9664 [Dactylellina haptotyla CBS 200.50]|uniref:Uncharacterized protein n=1 Tax=Dactylellina haptotyla (strain CBS 200.50) TaxID=1284197 RepID=S8A6N4_DACHA|nr:hypothetical protein H072_9664 [Dactylellina haptotyla CBS 200.50]